MKLRPGTITLSALATIAGQLLAVFGFVTLVFTGGAWLYRTLTFTDAAAVARPICERLLFPVGSVADVPADGSWRLVGVSILSVQGLPEARVRLRGFDPVVAWAVYSDGLAPAEKEAVLRALPIGASAPTLTSEPLPPLPKESITTLVAVARPKIEDVGVCDADFVEVLSSAGKVYHIDPTRFMFRGWFLGVSPVYFVLGYILTIAIVLWFVHMKRRRKTAAEESVESGQVV